MTATIALLGHPVAHSLSPRFQQAALDALGIDARYEAWDTSDADLRVAVERLRSGGMLGANVTVPHKVAVAGLVDRPDPLAELAGAVNTIVRRDGLLYATNTDVAGVLRAIEEAGITVRGSNVLLVGAGGVARAVVVAMQQGGAASLTIANRTLEKARQLVAVAGADLAVQVCPLDPTSDAAAEALRAPMSRAELVIHSTSLGMRHGPDEQATPVPPELFRAEQTAFDLVYARTIGGLSMLIHQGAESFRLWTGEAPPLDVMFAAARSAAAEG